MWCCGCSSGEEVCQSAREHARTLRSTPYTAHAAQHTVCQRCACPEIDTQTTRDVAAETFCPVVESALRDAPLTSTRATAVAYKFFPHAPTQVYSIRFLWEELLAQHFGSHASIEILGTDVSAAQIDTCRDARYLYYM